MNVEIQRPTYTYVSCLIDMDWHLVLEKCVPYLNFG